MSEQVDWEKIRRDFPVTEHAAYLNSAAAGPIPHQVNEAASAFYREMLEAGDAGWDRWLEEREIMRSRVAEFINAERDEIAFTTNTSSGMNLIVDALENRGSVVSCDLEFPVSTITWMHRGLNVSLVKTVDGELSAADVERSMNSETGVICLSLVQYSNGLRINPEEFAQIKKSSALVINASQAAGAFEIDVKRMRIDALCATGHKWMLSGYGSGFVYLSREILQKTRPRSIGWLSVEDPYADRNDEVRVRMDASARAELGCPHFAGIFALGASVDYMMEIGTRRIEERVLELNRHLTARLTEAGWRVLSPLRDESMRSAETLVAVEQPGETVEHLKRRGIYVTRKPEGIRIATHFFNNEEEIARLIDALEETRG
ncbi:MAG TPA: aminotransferase class V-fold PLP-dependent enzyme [Pyrinomonadaceae bacterium]|nr:aminotransferase class V-fold PLP-dependent enzyme [Pyrinomonadaceae bacterium]